MQEHGGQTDPSTHCKNYVHGVHQNGESNELDLEAIWTDSDMWGTLKFASESTVEEQEGELIEFYSQEADDAKDKLTCS